MALLLFHCIEVYQRDIDNHRENLPDERILSEELFRFRLILQRWNQSF